MLLRTVSDALRITCMLSLLSASSWRPSGCVELYRAEASVQKSAGPVKVLNQRCRWAGTSQGHRLEEAPSVHRFHNLSCSSAEVSLTLRASPESVCQRPRIESATRTAFESHLTGSAGQSWANYDSETDSTLPNDGPAVPETRTPNASDVPSPALRWRNKDIRGNARQ